MSWSEEELEQLLKNGKVRIHNDKRPQVFLEEKQSKYHAKRVKVDGILFDSKKEAEYYTKLKLLLKAGQITAYARQIEFVLQEGISSQRPIMYFADFLVIEKTGHCYVVDVKGLKTQVYNIKKKMLLAKYPDLDFREA